MRTIRPVAPSILRIAESLFAQVKAYGHMLGLHRKREGPLLAEPAAERFKFIRGYFQLMEEYAGLCFDPAEIPLLYNTQEWPEGGEPAGHAGAGAEVAPSQLVVSYVGMWTMQWDSDYAPAERVTKAALWVYRARGVEAALRYVLALQAHGFVFDAGAAAAAMSRLLAAHRSSASDEEAVASFFGGETPSDARAWMFTSAKPTFDKGSPVRRELPARLLSVLVESALEYVERAREARSYDEWLLGQIILEPLLDGVAYVCGLYWRTDDPFVKGVFDQLEEIDADAGAVRSTLKPSLHANLASVKLLTLIFSGRFPGDDWLTRLIEERCVVAYDLRRYVEADLELKGLPPEWTMLSETLAPVYLSRAHGLSPAAPWRARPFDADDLRATPATADALAGMNLGDPELQELVVWGLRVLAEGYWRDEDLLALAPVLKAAHGDAWGLEKYARADALAPADAKRSQGLEEWKKDNKERLTRFLNDVAASLCRAELLGRLRRAWEVEQTARLERVKELLELYPRHAPIHLEVGIAYDECGRPESALPHLEAAVFSEPTVALYWQSLAVVLKRLGESEGARVATVISRTLAEPEQILDGT